MRLLLMTNFCKTSFGWRVFCRHDHTGTPNVRVRFAPSPTGQLHLGGLRTAIYNYLFCRSLNGKFLLRIEDTDQTRLVPGATERLIDMLQWAGINIDEGPHCGGSYGPYIQSQRLQLYWEEAQKLLQSGAAYQCFCTEKRLELLRKQTVAQGETPKYDNRCRHLADSSVQEKLAAGVPYVIRFKLEHHTDPWLDLVYGPITNDVASIEGDPILMKSDRYPTYHFANVVDDHYMNITHVLRGVEWQVSTTKHILLYNAFNWSPPKYAHLPLLQNRDGKKLSKRQSDVNVEHYKELGYFPEAVLNLLTSCGSGFTVRETAGMTLQQLIKHFDLSKVNTNSTRVDFDKLLELNRLHLKQIISHDDTIESKSRHSQLIDHIRREVTLKFCSSSDSTQNLSLFKKSLSDEYINRILNWSQDRICLISDLLKPEYEFLWFRPTSVFSTEFSALSGIITIATVCDILKSTASILRDINRTLFTKDNINHVLNAVGRQGGQMWTYKQYMQLLRLVVTGRAEGPAVAEILAVLGRDATMQRIEDVIAQISDKRTSNHFTKDHCQKDIVTK